MGIRESFIESLNMPAGVEIKHFNGMNRYHLKYYGVGFMTLDLYNESYMIRTREKYLRSIHVNDYILDKNHSTNPASIKNIPYDDTNVLYSLVDYIIGCFLGIDDIQHNLVIIKINKTYYDGISERELYEYTRGYWKRRIESVQPAEYALAVVNGQVIEVYRIDNWVSAEHADNIIRKYDPVKYSDRIAFVGEVASGEVRNYYLGKNVTMLYKNGEADPVKLFLKNNGTSIVDRGINNPMLPQKVIIIDGRRRFVCGRCGLSFCESKRCPECGQLVDYGGMI